jgi:thiamine-phosphate pyrophosphorylase
LSALSGLYAITVDGQHGDTLLSNVRNALLGGCRVLQYRDKSSDTVLRLQEANALSQLCKQTGALFIINDDVDLCLQSKAHGVHLGRDDTALDNARKALGRNSLIGVSCYDDLQLAETAAERGADYVAFGAIYPSMTKPAATSASPSLLQQACMELSIPIVAIGGITPENAAPVIQAGADMVAMIQGLFAQEDIQHTAHHITQLFEKYRGNP